MALTSSVEAKNMLLNSYGSTLIKMTGLNSTGAVVTSTPDVNWAGASGGTKDVLDSVTLEVTPGSTVTHIRIYEGLDGPQATNYIDIALSVGESFPDGGNLIVTSFAVSLGDV